MSQLHVLHILNVEPGMNTGNLAERLGARASPVTGIVDRLVRQDLVERRGDSEDHCIVCNQLSIRGTEVLSDLARAGREFTMNILDRLSEEELLEPFRGVGSISLKAQQTGLQISREMPRRASPTP